MPLILLAYCGYLAIFVRSLAKRHWRGWLLWLGATAVLSLPLILTLQQQPTSEARVAELALPLTEARAGNFQPLWQYTYTTLGMFHTTGDNEWLYNIPDRPVFGPISALIFWLGILLALKLTIGNWQLAINKTPPSPLSPPLPPPLVAGRHFPRLHQHPARQSQSHHSGSTSYLSAARPAIGQPLVEKGYSSTLPPRPSSLALCAALLLCQLRHARLA